jgi:uncharacterized protein (TIGR00730 family)
MNIAVYCSSSNHIAENYISSAFLLGEWIAESKNVLVFGGATGGLMDAVSQGVFSKKGEIIGVIPQAVIRMNRQSSLCTKLIEVQTMSERKEEMKKLADVFVVLPGSYGTLDEMFDVIASAVVGEHKKPLILVNENHFYSDLLAQTERMRMEMFIPVENYIPIVVDSITSCIDYLKTKY